MAAPGVDMLSRIAAERRRGIDEMKARMPAHQLRARLPAMRPAGRLERALRRGPSSSPLRLMCEIKRASPSRGMLREDLDPAAIAKAYEAGGAAAISIVTEPAYFRGDLAWVNSVRPVVQLPILLKDFVADSWQLMDAAARGTDGVRLITEARLLGLDCLVEVHTEDELKVSLRAGATLVGINNRDLRTLEVDLETSLKLLPKVPPMVTAVAESGIATPEDLARLRATRCDAVLMGEVFMISEDPAAMLQRLQAAARG
jgi:indole-3-glycerol phosphate synthase